MVGFVVGTVVGTVVDFRVEARVDLMMRRVVGRCVEGGEARTVGRDGDEADDVTAGEESEAAVQLT